MQTNVIKRSTVPNCDSNRLLLFIKDIILDYLVVDIDRNVRVNLALLFRTSTVRSVCSKLTIMFNITLVQDKYGSQRMFGSIGWGVTMFIMGIVLDYSTIFPSAK